MNDAGQLPGEPLPAGHDQTGMPVTLGISAVSFKLLPADERGPLIIENTFHARGGPARHLHHAQDEWFYALEGQFVVEVGDRRHELGAGDSLLAPRGVPHAWAHTGDGRGRMLIVFLPAGQMVEFFRLAGGQDAMPAMDPALWAAHGMALVGPPLAV